MTEAQRDYLADLAGRKGVRLDDTDDNSPAWASAKIEELKAMLDVEFEEDLTNIDGKINARVKQISGEVSKWTFQE